MTRQPKARRPRRQPPERTCVACRIAQPKRELIRLVRSDTGIEIDATGKKAGRGAYLCRYSRCWIAGLERRALDRALKADLTPEDRQTLAAFARELPTAPPGGST